MDTKLCQRCGETKPTADFSPTSKWCRPCCTAYKREWRRRNPQRSTDLVYEQRLKRDFGMSLAQYKVMLEEQKGLCAICGAFPSGRRPRLQVDHDHVTGAVRALLCTGCNRGLAGFKDDPMLIERAIAYVERWGS